MHKENFRLLMGPLQLSDHLVQNRQTGEQMTHWDMLNKATKFECSLFSMSQCVNSSSVCDFVPRDRSAAKRSFQEIAVTLISTINDSGTLISIEWNLSPHVFLSAIYHCFHVTVFYSLIGQHFRGSSTSPWGHFQTPVWTTEVNPL